MRGEREEDQLRGQKKKELCTFDDEAKGEKKEREKFFIFLLLFLYYSCNSIRKSELTDAQVEKSDSCQYLQTAQYRASCKQGAMSVLESWYQAEGRRGTGIV